MFRCLKLGYSNILSKKKKKNVYAHHSKWAYSRLPHKKLEKFSNLLRHFTTTTIKCCSEI
jgi:hypothetical protein